jgi:hypothetical protein
MRHFISVCCLFSSPLVRDLLCVIYPAFLNTPLASARANLNSHWTQFQIFNNEIVRTASTTEFEVLYTSELILTVDVLIEFIGRSNKNRSFHQFPYCCVNVEMSRGIHWGVYLVFVFYHRTYIFTHIYIYIYIYFWASIICRIKPVIHRVLQFFLCSWNITNHLRALTIIHDCIMQENDRNSNNITDVGNVHNVTQSLSSVFVRRLIVYLTLKHLKFTTCFGL